MTVEFLKITRTVLGTAARVLLAQLRGNGDEGDDATAEPIDAAEVVQPLGLFARPALTAHTEAVALRLGDQVVVLTVQDKSLSVLSVPEGATWLYGAQNPAACVRLNADGTVDILSAGDVRVKSGSTPVAKEGSATAGHTHTASYVLNANLTTGVVTGTITIATNHDTIATGAGSANVKVP